jgi:predicted RNA-binding protein
MRFIVQIVIKSEYGELRGEKVQVTQEQYDNIANISKNFYMGGFEMILEDGTFVVIAPDVIKKSILLIDKKEIQ